MVVKGVSLKIIAVTYFGNVIVTVEPQHNLDDKLNEGFHVGNAIPPGIVTQRRMKIERFVLAPEFLSLTRSKVTWSTSC